MANPSKKSTKKPQKKQGFKKYIIGFWTLFGLGILAIILIFLFAGMGFFGKMPKFEELENPETNVATEIFSSDGKTLGKYYNENRTPVKFEDLPDNVVHALIATEDIRYYEHSGIDARGTLRATVFLGQRGGASTITQQLAKQLFTEDVSQNFIGRVIQKVKEWIIAVRLERNYTKREILAMYFNIYDFNNNADGIRSATRIYFGKEPKELKVEEAAVLAGMFKNSSLYNPRRNPVGVTNRRNVVLNQMAKAGYITYEEKDSLQKLPLKIDYHPESHQEGIATYFRMYLRGFLKDWAKKNPKPDGETYNIYRDGLKVYTSIDYKMQEYAEEAVAMHMANMQKEFNRQNEGNKTAPFRDIDKDEIEHIINNAMHISQRWRKMKDEGKSEEQIRKSFDIKREMSVFSWSGTKDTIMTPRDSIFYYKSFLQTGLMSMTPQTGEIKAWVGGIDLRNFQYEHVKQAKRQVGSTFKPFVYATAIDQLKLSPCDTLPKNRFTIEAGKMGNQKDWSPANAEDDYEGMLTLKEALAESVNTVTARIMYKIGPRPVINLLSKLGVDTRNIPAVPSIALGTADMSVFEMVSAYSAFVNEGVYVKPVIVTRIEDKNGTILYQNVPETRDVLSKETAYVTVNLMEGVTQSGTGTRLRGNWAKNNAYYKKIMTGYPYDFKNPIAGKTGTTQNGSDGWFMGMVPNLVTGIWVGGEDRSIHFPTIRYGQGAAMALPIWGIFMKKVYADKDLDISSGAFPRPENLSIETDCANYGKHDANVQKIPDELDF